MFEEKTNRPNFEQFRSNTCHKLKDLGDLPFISQLLESNQIQTYYEKQWYPEALYLLAMLDYPSNINAIPFCCSYNDIRNARLVHPLYPSDVLLLCKLLHSDSPKEDALRKAIPEFLRFNIVECDRPTDSMCRFHLVEISEKDWAALISICGNLDYKSHATKESPKAPLSNLMTQHCPM